MHLWSKDSQPRNVLTFLGLILGVLVSGVSLGLCPRLADLETKANAKVEHRIISNSFENLRVEHDNETQRIYKTIERMQEQQDEAQRNLKASLETLDKRTWQILRELKE